MKKTITPPRLGVSESRKRGTKTDSRQAKRQKGRGQGGKTAGETVKM